MLNSIVWKMSLSICFTLGKNTAFSIIKGEENLNYYGPHHVSYLCKAGWMREILK